jgi:hypothetical protein
VHKEQNMLNNNRINTNLFNSAEPVARTELGLSSLNRQSRFDARAERRWGNWGGFLEFPTPLLWLETEPVMCVGNECLLEEPALIELWP